MAEDRRSGATLPAPVGAFARQDSLAKERPEQPDLRELAKLLPLVDQDCADERWGGNPGNRPPPAPHREKVFLVRFTRHDRERVTHIARDERDAAERFLGRRDSRRDHSQRALHGSRGGKKKTPPTARAAGAYGAEACRLRSWRSSAIEC